MSRTRLVLLGLLAAFALSAVASSPALAAHEFKVNGTTVATGEKVEMIGNSPGHHQPQWEISIGNTILHIQCQRVTLSLFFLLAAGRISLSLLFSGCTSTIVVGQRAVIEPGCKIKNGEIKVEGEGELTGAGEITMKTTSGKVSIEKVEKGECTTEGEYTVTGSQICTLPHYSVETAVALLECNPAGSSINLEKTEKSATKIYGTFAIAGAKGQKISSS
jgi:hypothetical protein